VRCRFAETYRDLVDAFDEVATLIITGLKSSDAAEQQFIFAMVDANWNLANGSLQMLQTAAFFSTAAC
jgi:hypothetical protein